MTDIQGDIQTWWRLHISDVANNKFDNGMLRGNIPSPDAREWIVADVGVGWKSESLIPSHYVAMLLSEGD